MDAPNSAGRDVNIELDRRLLRAVADGSTEALGHLYDRHVAIVYGLARRVVSRLEDAEEVVQDVFTQIWREAGRYRSERASVAGWIVMLARTRAIDRLRARRARPDDDRGVEPSPLLTLPSPAGDPEAVTIAAERAARIQRTLALLPDNQRVLLEQAYYQGLSHAEIAERTGVPLGTVKTRIRAAMETLRGALS